MSSTDLMNSNRARAGCHYAVTPLTRRCASMPNIKLLTPAETVEKKIKPPFAATAKSRSLPAELNAAVTVCHYAVTPLNRRYASMPNIKLLTPAETVEKKIKAPFATTAKSGSLPAELNAAVTVCTCVDLLQGGTADAAIKDRVVPATNTAFKPRGGPLIVSSAMSLNDMHLDVAKCRMSCYAASRRLEKVYFSTPNIALMTAPETANRVPSSCTISLADDGAENPDRTIQECRDSGPLCAGAETPGHTGGDNEHRGQTSCKSRKNVWKRTKNFFKSLLCCCTSYSSEQ
ncbi:hypothetical protein FRX31_034004 [Thalictrum thalictroides]|uniref:Uncharacterized protein n=1 Tax=Thalictrum thalictroides TaxID=46969 RepID=A0A7J6UV15_THATH|nr:hypothetical protein FRX31_034004 [Thalictrum thalictroides]